MVGPMGGQCEPDGKSMIMKTKNSIYALGISIMAILFTVSPHVANSASLLDMVDKLDKLDQQDFQGVLNKANDCTIERKFSCSEEQLRKAEKLANGSKDKQALNTAKQKLRAEKQRVKEEELARAEQERQTRLAEERRAREEERREEERRLMAQRQQQESSSSSTNYGQSFAKGVNDAVNFQNNLGKIQDNTVRDINRITQENKARAETERQARNERAETDRRDRENERIRQQNKTNRERQERDQREADRRAEERANERRIKQAQLLAKQEDLERKQAIQKEEARKQAQARKKAEDEAAKIAEQKAEKLASDKYLKSVAAGTRLVAKTCPDGEGKYYATGKRPHINPEVVSCVDVHYRAYCPGSTQPTTTGIAGNFVGVAGCFGDTYEINPKPPCKVDQVRIEVIKAVSCGM